MELRAPEGGKSVQGARAFGFDPIDIEELADDGATDQLPVEFAQFCDH